ncbi:serine/threonine kinase [Anaeramoeba flamelloides]|uniref:non-specific serine/threonine protein kinase n=1 Tax=Anaeramoeba flamelloides TaxID=1746091 RepID=A0ABQ8Z790_9EUKA|nr:serine/threonine kinase [Anaeramoeba flamelloides]
MLQIPSNYENLKITFGQLNIKTYCAVYQPNCIKVKIVLVSNCKRSLASDDKLSKIISLLHFNLTDLYETIQSQEGIVLVTEDFGETSLMEYILDKPLQQRVEGSAKIISQLLNVAEYLENEGMLCLSLNAFDVIIDEKNNLKLCRSNLFRKFLMRLWTKKQNGKKKDLILQLGSIFYLLFSTNPKVELKNLKNGNLVFQAQNIAQHPINFLIKKMISKNCLERPTLNEIKNHLWVQENIQKVPNLKYLIQTALQKKNLYYLHPQILANMEKKKVQIEKLVNDLVNQINSQETTLYKKLFSNLWTKEVEEEYNEKKIIKKEKYQKIIQLIKEIISNNNNNQSKSKKENDNKNEKENENEKGYDCIKNNTKKRKEKTKEGIDNGSSETNSTANKNSSNEIPFERELVLLSDTSDNKLFFSFGKEQKQNNSDPKEKPKLKIIKKPEKRAFQREETGENKENWGEVGGEEKIAEKKKDQEKKKKKKTMKMKMKMKEDNKTTNQNKKTNDGDFGKKFDQIEESNKMEELELRKILGEIKLFKNDLNVSDQSNSTERMIRKIEREKIKTTRRHQRSYSKRKEDEKKKIKLIETVITPLHISPEMGRNKLTNRFSPRQIKRMRSILQKPVSKNDLGNNKYPEKMFNNQKLFWNKKVKNSLRRSATLMNISKEEDLHNKIPKMELQRPNSASNILDNNRRGLHSASFTYFPKRPSYFENPLNNHKEPDTGTLAIHKIFSDPRFLVKRKPFVSQLKVLFDNVGISWKQKRRYKFYCKTYYSEKKIKFRIKVLKNPKNNNAKISMKKLKGDIKLFHKIWDAIYTDYF